MAKPEKLMEESFIPSEQESANVDTGRSLHGREANPKSGKKSFKDSSTLLAAQRKALTKGEATPGVEKMRLTRPEWRRSFRAEVGCFRSSVCGKDADGAAENLLTET